ncbi:MAG TPA: hypothetical protein VM509_10640 [Planctomycetota bacterium]|nr:hypothetical protein [Planctomycetota bacterium]
MKNSFLTTATCFPPRVISYVGPKARILRVMRASSCSCMSSIASVSRSVNTLPSTKKRSRPCASCTM